MGFPELLTCKVQPYPTLFTPLSWESGFAAMLNPAEAPLLQQPSRGSFRWLLLVSHREMAENSIKERGFHDSSCTK